MAHLNADDVRRSVNDWDFSEDGRIRQAWRMLDRAMQLETIFEVVLVDMVAPLEEQRDIIEPDVTIWMNTIRAGRYQDTNEAWEDPEAGIIITSHDAADIFTFFGR
jgi:adenylylsulfate kinase